MSTVGDVLSADAAIQSPGNVVVAWLQKRVAALMERVKEEEFWKTAMAPDAPDGMVQGIMREVYLEIVGYQPDVIEAAIAAIGQMPRSIQAKLIRSMLYHQSDEWDHGEMALRDYICMGGDEDYARQVPMSPASFAVAGVWWMIVHSREPFRYLGALYLFEGLTPTVTGAIKGLLREKGMRPEQLEYVEFHSTEDVKHANLVDHLIASVVDMHPERAEAVKEGYEYFEAVYPIPVWRAAYERALNGSRSVDAP